MLRKKNVVFASLGQKHFCLPDTNFTSETYVSKCSTMKTFFFQRRVERAHNTEWLAKSKRKSYKLAIEKGKGN